MPMPMDTEISHDFHNHIQWPPGFQQQRDVAGFSTTKSYGQEAMTGLDENRGGEEESLLLNAAAGPSLLQYLSMPASGTRPNEYMSFDDDHSKNSGFQDPMFSGPAITAAASVGPNDQVYDPSVPRAFPTTPPQFGDCQSIDSIGKSLGLDHHDIIDHDGGIMNVPFGSHWDHVTVATGLHDFRQNSPPSAADAPSSPYSGSAFSSPTELDFTPDNASAITAPTPTANANTITGSTGEDAFSKYASIDAVTASSELFHTPPNSSLFPVANRFTPDIVSELDDDATPYVDYGHGGAPESAALAVSDDLQYQYQYQTEQEQLTPSPENDADVRHVEDVSEMEALTISAADMEALSTIPWTNTPMMIWENPSTALATDSREQAGKENHDTAIGMHATAAAAGAANEDDDDGFISDSAIFDRHGSVKNCLPPALPHGHDHNKYLLVIDTQNGRRMRIKGTLQNTDIGEIPDSYCKANAVFPRSWRPRHGPVGDEEFGSEDATNDTDRKTPNKSSEEPFTILPLLHRPKGGRWYKVSDTIDSASGVIHPSLSSHDIYQQVPDGPYPKNDPAEKATNGVISVLLANGKWTEFNIPRPRKRRTECALNELGYRMSWTASRALSKRPLFLQRALDQYRKKVCLKMGRAGVPITKEREHFVMRPGKKKWIEKYGLKEIQDNSNSNSNNNNSSSSISTTASNGGSRVDSFASVASLPTFSLAPDDAIQFATMRGKKRGVSASLYDTHYPNNHHNHQQHHQGLLQHMQPLHDVHDIYEIPDELHAPIRPRDHDAHMTYPFLDIQ